MFLGGALERETGVEEEKAACWQVSPTAEKEVRRAFARDQAAEAPEPMDESQAASYSEVVTSQERYAARSP